MLSNNLSSFKHFDVDQRAKQMEKETNILMLIKCATCRFVKMNKTLNVNYHNYCKLSNNTMNTKHELKLNMKDIKKKKRHVSNTNIKRK